MHKTVDVTVEVHALREAVVQQLMGMKHPEASVDVPVPLAALGPLARAILEHARRPPSRRGRGPLRGSKAQLNPFPSKCGNYLVSRGLGVLHGTPMESLNPGGTGKSLKG